VTYHRPGMVVAGSAPDSPSVAAARLIQVIENEFRDGLEAARAVNAAGPEGDAESLRVAYLDLLKLCLCDLAGTSTTSVARTQQGHVMSRELRGEQLRMRAAGMDWPLHGLTMVGLRRLDDLQACVESVVRDGVPGDVIEAGSWRGGASLLMRATLNTLGADERAVVVADSFQGFPEAEGDLSKRYDLSLDLAGCDFLAVPLEEVRETFARFGFRRGVTFVPGFFQDTLPGLTGRQWSIIRLDGDTYEAAWTGMASLYGGLSAGGYVVVDDYASLDRCREAIDDFREQHGITEPIEQIDWSGVRWRKENEALSPAAPGGAPAAPSSTSPRPVQRGPRARVPAIEEVALSEEVERLRERLAAAEAEVDRLVASPLAGPRTWLRRRRSEPRPGNR
jgi:O-methyltransferase